MGSKMDNKMGVSILSSILHRMSYPNMVLSKKDDVSQAIDVKALHSLLLKGCQQNQRIPGSSSLTLLDREISETILIHVITIGGKTINVYVKATACAKDLKEKILSKEGIPLDQQRLIYAGRQLLDEEILVDRGIKDETTLSYPQTLWRRWRNPAVCHWIIRWKISFWFHLSSWQKGVQPRRSGLHSSLRMETFCPESRWQVRGRRLAVGERQTTRSFLICPRRMARLLPRDVVQQRPVHRRGRIQIEPVQAFQTRIRHLLDSRHQCGVQIRRNEDTVGWENVQGCYPKSR